MTPEQLQAIRQELRNLDDRELLRRVALEESEFLPEAMQIAREELQLRNIKPLTADEFLANFSNEPSALGREVEKEPVPEGRQEEGAQGASAPQYGGFWRRFAALWLDILVLSPVALIFVWLDAQTRYAQAYFVLPNLILGVFYHVYLVQRFGGTPGKLIMRLNITRLNGLPVGRKEAFLRYLPELVLSVWIGIGTAYASFDLTDADQALSYMDRAQRRANLIPGFGAIQVLNSIWVWSELLVLLTNKKRRALHDFLAGTVVIRHRVTAA
jgi:uncharacterized RDD family membrane protein YckC